MCEKGRTRRGRYVSVEDPCYCGVENFRLVLRLEWLQIDTRSLYSIAGNGDRDGFILLDWAQLSGAPIALGASGGMAHFRAPAAATVIELELTGDDVAYPQATDSVTVTVLDYAGGAAFSPFEHPLSTLGSNNAQGVDVVGDLLYFTGNAFVQVYDLVAQEVIGLTSSPSAVGLVVSGSRALTTQNSLTRLAISLGENASKP